MERDEGKDAVPIHQQEHDSPRQGNPLPMPRQEPHGGTMLLPQPIVRSSTFDEPLHLGYLGLVYPSECRGTEGTWAEGLGLGGRSKFMPPV